TFSSFSYSVKRPGMTFASLATTSKARGFGTAGDCCGVPGSVEGSCTVAATAGEACGAGVVGDGTGPGGEVGGVCCGGDFACAKAVPEAAAMTTAERKVEMREACFMRAPVKRERRFPGIPK